MVAKLKKQVGKTGGGKLRTSARFALVLIAAVMLAGGAFAALPTTRILSGSTNRVCAASAPLALTGPLDSYWQDTGSDTLQDWFRICFVGFMLMFK